MKKLIYISVVLIFTTIMASCQKQKVEFSDSESEDALEGTYWRCSIGNGAYATLHFGSSYYDDAPKFSIESPLEYISGTWGINGDEFGVHVEYSSHNYDGYYYGDHWCQYNDDYRYYYYYYYDDDYNYNEVTYSISSYKQFAVSEYSEHKGVMKNSVSIEFLGVTWEKYSGY